MAWQRAGRGGFAEPLVWVNDKGATYEQRRFPVCPLCVVEMTPVYRTFERFDASGITVPVTKNSGPPGKDPDEHYCPNCRFMINEGYLKRFRGTVNNNPIRLGSQIEPPKPVKVHPGTRVIVFEDEEESVDG